MTAVDRVSESHRRELAASHARVMESLGSVTDEQMREPSRLPGWSRDMLVAHLRFGAEAAIRGINGVRSGSSSTMYPGGDGQRDAEIASGAGVPAAQLVAELTSACVRLEAALDELPAAAFDGLIHTRRGPVPVSEVLLQRWLDVEVHHVDLDLGYTRDRWPDALIDAYLPGLIALMPALRTRPDADVSISGSWHVHRTDGPGEWTVYADGEDASVEAGHTKADCALRGSGHDLLAFVIGRAGPDAIDTLGDQAKAADFKAAFPGP